LDAVLKKSQQALQEQQAAFDLKLAQQQKEIEELKLLFKGNLILLSLIFLLSVKVLILNSKLRCLKL